jgi:hypothetical protein
MQVMDWFDMSSGGHRRSSTCHAVFFPVMSSIPSTGEHVQKRFESP